MITRQACLTVALLGAFVGRPAAQPVSGLYVGAGIGANLQDPIMPSSLGSRIITLPGPVGVAAVGWRFGNGLRLELEGSYRGNEVDRVKTRRGNGQLMNLTDVAGRVGTAAVMINALYEPDLRRFGITLRPYVGGGIGVGWRGYDGIAGDAPTILRLPDVTVIGPARSSRIGTYSHLAYQAIGGVAYPLPFLRGLELTAEYRYLGMDSVKYRTITQSSGGFTINGAVPRGQSFAHADIRNHSILLGLRYSFGPLRL